MPIPSDVPRPDPALRDAAPALSETGMSWTPRLGAPAMPFRVRTTRGERSLADYRGRWLLLFSHPADFTPVCTSEFIAFARAHGRFQALGCELLGLSVDSLFAHLAWVRSIEAGFGVEIPFPIAEDISQAGDGEPTAPPALPTLQDLLTSPILPHLGTPPLAGARLSAQVSTAKPLRITWAAAYL